MRYKAKAIGAGSEGAQVHLTEDYSVDMTLAEAEEMALKTLKGVMEEKITKENVEMAKVTKDQGYHVCSEEEVESILTRL